MDCSNIRPLISAYYDGDVTPEEHAQVERHLAGCEDCSRALAEYRAIGGDMRALAMPVPPVGLRRDVWRAIEAQERRAGLFGSPNPRASAPPVPRNEPARGSGKGSILDIFTGSGSGWLRALPAAILVGGLLVVMAFLFIDRINNPKVEVAQIEEAGELTDYDQPIHVKFSKSVVTSDVP